jgi:16S rRNA C1402 (ribose-2'-O) methylase RsmI
LTHNPNKDACEESGVCSFVGKLGREISEKYEMYQQLALRARTYSRKSDRDQSQREVVVVSHPNKRTKRVKNQEARLNVEQSLSRGDRVKKRERRLWATIDNPRSTLVLFVVALSVAVLELLGSSSRY